MVKTKCLMAAPEDSDGKRILVTRFWPRWKKREELQLHSWVKDVAPSRELLADWKAKRIFWTQYVARYKDEMTHQVDAIDSLAAIAANETITLLCYEAEDDPHCHRHLLKEMLDNWDRHEYRKV